MGTNNNYITNIPSSSFLTANRIFFIDFFLFNVAYFLSNFLKRGSFELAANYVELLVLFYICWFVASFAGKKFEDMSYVSLRSGILCLGKAAIYMTYCIAFAVVILGVSGFSRIQIFSTCLIVFVLECVVWYGYSSFFNSKDKENRDSSSLALENEAKKISFSYSLFGTDFLLLVFAFFVANYLKRGTLLLPPNYERLFLIILGIWFTVSLITNKYTGKSEKSYYFLLAQWLKAGGIMLAIVSIAVFGLRLFYFSRFQSYGSILILLFLEVLMLRLFVLWRRNNARNNDIESLEKVKKVLSQESLFLDVDVETIRQRLLEPIRDKLKSKLGEKDTDLFDFINEHVELDKILCMETAADNSRKLFSLSADQIPIRLFLNLRKINDIRRINKYFLDIHQTLVPGGYFIGRAHTIVTHKEWVYSKFPKAIVKYVYLIDFCINRVMPKLPWIQKLYFSITNGKNRLMSRAELLGRLSFCGFEIVAEKNIDKRLCVIARKIKTPALDVNPTYGPFVELKRIGFNNEIVKVYKLRTMHPYSEYLQSYVFKLAGLQKGGKIEDDFRTTGWGLIMRKLWIDELPMIYNWLKGDLQLVGVRPLSLQYFSLYDQELQEMRGLVKPGLVPPFYVDMPETFEEICESEKRYIRAFLKNPFRTQVIYFCKAFINIVLRGARSK